MQEKRDLIIIGGGAAGMMAAIFAARAGKKVHLLERNEKLGKKIYITGKGRCNYTNATDFNGLIEAMMVNPKFMYGAFKSWDSNDTIDFFNDLSCPGKVERGNRVFPISDKSSDIIKALSKEMERLKVKISFNCKVKSLVVSDNICRGVITEKGEKLLAEKTIVATGGKSYPSTGSTGDGYKWAKDLSIDVIKALPALAPLNCKEDWPLRMQGVSLKNVEVTIWEEESNKVHYKAFGEMLFTHFGVSGPLILSAESNIVEILESKELKCSIDWKPALDTKTLDARLLREIEEAKKSSCKNMIRKLLPAKAVPVILDLARINPDKASYDITKEERKALVSILKKSTMTISSSRNFNEAIITRGGISIKEINPKTFEAKKCKGLYFIGEVLDLDAITGGFNLQIAWASAHSCAINL